MSVKIEIVGGTPEEMLAKLREVAEKLLPDTRTAKPVGMTAEELVDALQAAVPDMTVVLQPRETKKPKPKAEAKAAPASTPADMRAEATQLLVAAFDQEAKKEAVKELLKKFGVKKFADVPDDKVPELLLQAKAI